MPSFNGEVEWRNNGEREIAGTKKPPVGGLTTLLIALIILQISNGTRSGT